MTCCDRVLEWKTVSPSWTDPALLRTECPGCGKTYERKNGLAIFYIENGDGFKCSKCDADIMSAKIVHPVKGDLLKETLSREINKEEIVPYCPACEKRPPWAGKIIKLDASSPF